jgi:hypothetical protein
MYLPRRLLCPQLVRAVWQVALIKKWLHAYRGANVSRLRRVVPVQSILKLQLNFVHDIEVDVFRRNRTEFAMSGSGDTCDARIHYCLLANVSALKVNTIMYFIEFKCQRCCKRSYILLLLENLNECACIMFAPPKRSRVFSSLFTAFCLLLAASILGPNFPGRALCYSLSLIALCDGLFSELRNRYNPGHPQSPIRMWHQEICLAVITLLIGAYNLMTEKEYFWIILAIGIVRTTLAVHYYTNDRSRTL